MSNQPAEMPLPRSRLTFAAFVRRHQGLVFRAAWSVCRDHDAAEDVAQEVFAQFLRDEPREVRSARGYLAWQAIALARRRLRGDLRRKEREEEAVRRRALATDPGLELEDRLAIQDEVEKLPGDERACIELHYFGALTREEVAASLGISTRTVATRLEEGRRMLRKRLAPSLLAASPFASDGPGLACPQPSPRLARALRGMSASLPGWAPAFLLFLGAKTKVALVAAAVLVAAAGSSPLWAPRRAVELAGPAPVPGPVLAARVEAEAPGDGGEGAGAGLAAGVPGLAGVAAAPGAQDFTVSGRLVEGLTGRPVAGQKVQTRSRRWLPAEREPAAVTDAEGRFRVSGSALGHGLSLEVERPGFIPLSRSVRLAEDEGDAGDLELFPASRASVLVLDAEGNPVPEAIVLARNPSGARAGSEARWARNHLSETALGKTDASGRVRYTMLRSGIWWIAAGKAGHFPGSTGGPVSFPVGREVEVTVRLPSAPALRVKVVDAAGKPLPGITVGPNIPFDATEAQPRLEVLDTHQLLFSSETGEDGVALLPRIDLPLELRVYGEGLFETQEVEVPPEETERTVLVDVNAGDHRPATVSGLVVSKGEIVPDFVIHGFGRDWRLNSGYQRRDGAFRFQGPPGPAEFRVDSVAHLPRTFTLDLPPGGTLTDVRIELEPGMAAEGKVVSAEEGRGLPRVNVMLQEVKEQHYQYDERSAPTDANGRFRVTGLVPGKYSVQIWGAGCGFVQRQEPLVIAGPMSGIIFTLPPSAKLRVRARDDDGIPMAPVQVVLHAIGERPPSAPEDLARFEGSMHTDLDQDEFEELHLDPGRKYQLEVDDDSLTPYVSPPLVLAPGEVKTLDLRLSLKPALHGRVLGPDGVGVKDASITLEYPDPPPHTLEDSPGADWREKSALTDELGQFWMLGCLPGKAVCVAEAAGAEKGRSAVEIPEKEDPVPVTIVLGEGLEIRGVVVAGDNTPLAGVTVSDGDQSAASDAQGRFQLKGFAPGAEAWLRVSKPGWHARGFLSTHVAAGARDVRIVLDRAAILRGRVEDAAGKPVTEFEATLAGNSLTDAGPELEDDRFTFDAVPAGSYRLLVAGREAGAMVVEVELRPGDVVEDLVVRLGAAVVARGRVVAAGKPVEGAEVVARLAQTPRGGGDLLVVASARTGPEGEFSLFLGEAFPLELSAKAPGLARGERRLQSAAEASAPIIIELRPGAMVTGRVHRRGSPVEGLEVRLRSPQGLLSGPNRDGSASTDAEGRFGLAATETGAVWINLSNGKGETRQVAVRIAKAGPTRVDIDLAAGLAITGTVAVPGGKPSRVGVTCSGERARLFAATRVEDSGRYRIEGLESGDYVVSWDLSLPDQGTASRRRLVQLVDADRTIDVVFAGAGVSGRVIGADARGIEGVRVVVSSVAEGVFDSAAQVTSSEGRFELPGLPAGIYRLAAAKQDLGMTAVAGIAIAEGAPVEGLEVRLKAGVPARVSVPGFSGPCLLSDLRGESVTFGYSVEGIMDFGKVEAGEYFLEGFDVLPESDLPRARVLLPVEFRGAEEPVPLDPEPGGTLKVQVKEASGRPAAGVAVRVWSAAAPEPPRGDFLMPETPALTGAAGCITFACPWGGKLVVEAAQAARVARAQVEVRGGDAAVDVVFPP